MYASTCMSPCTCLTYVTEQVWLPHCKYDSHSHYAKWPYRPNIFVCTSTLQPPATVTSCITAKYVPETNMPLQYQICQLVHVQTSDNYITIYTSHKINAFNNITTSTGIVTFHIIGICPWNKWTNNVVYMQTPSYCMERLRKPNKLQLQGV